MYSMEWLHWSGWRFAGGPVDLPTIAQWWRMARYTNVVVRVNLPVVD